MVMNFNKYRNLKKKVDVISEVPILLKKSPSQLLTNKSKVTGRNNKGGITV
jgi:hypothetical protein